MESEPIFELLEPGDVLILHKEDDAYICATNKEGDLCIERAFVPPTQVIKTETHCFPVGIALEPCVPGDLVKVCLEDQSNKDKDELNSITKDDMYKMAHSLCEIMNLEHKEEELANVIIKQWADAGFLKGNNDAVGMKINNRKVTDSSLYAGFDEEGNPTVTCDPDVASKKKLDEWVNKCNDQKMELWAEKCKDCKKESDTWPPGNWMVLKRKEARAQRVNGHKAKKSLEELLNECRACGLCVRPNKL